jgi:hypothetical protein
MLEGMSRMQEPEPEKERSDWKRLAPILGAAVVAVAGIGYAIHEHNNAQTASWQSQQMAAQLDATHKQLDATNSQLNVLAAKVDALNKPAPDVQPSRASAVRGAGSGTGAAAGSGSGSGSAGSSRARRAARDERFEKMQSQLDAQNQAIQDTRTDLTSAKTELSGSIAKTHDELVVLQKRGERNYYEFDLNKSKEFARTGPLSISLRKANDKKGYADLQLIVDDRTLQQKHVNLYQPAMFYDVDGTQPMEIVINEISKNHIHGYVSAPKYRRSELTAMSNPAPAQGNDSGAVEVNSQPPARQKLPVPKSDQQ